MIFFYNELEFIFRQDIELSKNNNYITIRKLHE